MLNYTATCTDDSGDTWTMEGAITGDWPFTPQMMWGIQFALTLEHPEDCEIKHLVVRGGRRELIVDWPTSDGVAEWTTRET